MLARSLFSIQAAFLSLFVCAAPACAETFVFTGVAQSADIIDPNVLEYGQTYPIPSPAYSVLRGYPHASWYESWRLRRSPSPVALYPHPCAWANELVELATPCNFVAVPVTTVVEAPLMPLAHRHYRHARAYRSCLCRRRHAVDPPTP
ncbi:MAG TPA: hypothetical protein VKU03_16205 [Roseiarcus sp.]|nr:hypothetical protein [Roseiarcus sp.]